MRAEQEFIIHTLSDHLAERTTSIPLDLDWVEVFRLSQMHQIGGIVYCQCKESMPQETLPAFKQRYELDVFQYVKRATMFRQIRQLFRENGISCFTVKGLSVARYYPVPALRTMGDLDIVIHREDRDKADSLLKDHGFRNTSHIDDREWIYFKDGMEYELHDHLVYSEAVNLPGHAEFFNRFWEYVKDEHLDPGFHFLFLVMHLRKHFMNSGVGFRQFMDIALMADKEPGMDWTWVQERLKELDLWTFARTCSGFIQKWFGIEIPIDPVVPDDPFYEEATELIFSNGIFGFHREENRRNRTVNEARNSRNHLIGMFSRAVREVFPPYRYLCTVKRYGYVVGRPYLIPAAWIHRYAHVLYRYGRRIKSLPPLFVSSAEIAKRDAFLKSWGL